MKWFKRKQQLLRISGVSRRDNYRSEIKLSGAWSEVLVAGGGWGETKPTNGPTLSKPMVSVVAIMTALPMIALLWQLLNLQIVEGDRMLGIAEGNRIRQHVELAPRGRILDRNGVVLADNTASFQLVLQPHLLANEGDVNQAIFEDISKHINLSAEEVAELSSSQDPGYNGTVLIAEHIDRESALLLEYVLPEHGAFSLTSVPTRKYKADAALSHILGYTARVSQSDLDARPELHSLDFVGRSGIEAEYDDLLRGVNGFVETEVDSMSRPLRVIGEIATSRGSDVILSIDYELQKQLYESLQDYMEEADTDKASGVVMDVNNGEILASVSLPDYDNNTLARGISTQDYEAMISNPSMPMFNRVISAGYPTGSTIKPITLLGALETGVVDENTIINDVGSITVSSIYDPSVTYSFASWNPNGLGPMNARSAIAMSSNIYFYTVAGGYQSFSGMGISNLVKYYQMLGLGSRTGIDIPGETAGRLPSPEWKQQHVGEGWFVGDTYNMAIGQGFLSVSPLQLARSYAAIVNGGRLVTPKLNSDIETKLSQPLGIKPSHYQITQEGMLQVLSSSGTASPAIFANVDVTVAGKSGTAETNPEDEDSRPHAWFAAYGPYEDPELVSVVMLEEGQNGALYAAPVIAEVFARHFNK